MPRIDYGCGSVRQVMSADPALLFENESAEDVARKMV
jgi:hypothetical protein